MTSEAIQVLLVALPSWAAQQLAEGPKENGCRVCHVLGGPLARVPEAEQLHDWHMVADGKKQYRRCLRIYGAAAEMCDEVTGQ